MRIKGSHHIFRKVGIEKKPNLQSTPSLKVVLSSYTSISMERYNEETITLLKESVKSWADEIKTERFKGGPVSTEPGSCGDIEF